MNKIILLFLVTVGLSWSGVAQQTDEMQQQTYFYSVTNVSSQEQLDKVVSSIEELKFVDKVKMNYKSEKLDKAQFIIYVTEPKRTSESQQMFEVTDLKKIIVENNLQPSEFKIDNH